MEAACPYSTSTKRLRYHLWYCCWSTYLPAVVRMRFPAGFILASCLALSQQAEIEISYRASSKVYNHVPTEFELILVAAFTRHGKILN